MLDVTKYHNFLGRKEYFKRY